MTARRLFAGGHLIEVSGTGYEPRGTFSMNGSGVQNSETLSTLLRAAVLASDARLEQKNSSDNWEMKGDPTEARSS